MGVLPRPRKNREDGRRVVEAVQNRVVVLNARLLRRDRVRHLLRVSALELHVAADLPELRVDRRILTDHDAGKLVVAGARRVKPRREDLLQNAFVELPALEPADRTARAHLLNHLMHGFYLLRLV